MTYPIKRDKTVTPTPTNSMEVQSQGTVPYKKMEDCSIPPAPSKGDMEARGFGLMMRSQMYKVR
jgi:hypothetical protein